MSKIIREEALAIYIALLQQSCDPALRHPEQVGRAIAKTAVTLAQVFDQVVEEG